MSEWSEEVRARLEARLHGTPAGVSGCCQPCADIQAALGEIERLRAWEDGGQQFLLERDELRKMSQDVLSELQIAKDGLKATADHRARVEAERDELRAEMMQAREDCYQFNEACKIWKARAEKAEAALRLCVLKRRGGTTADANVADEDIGEYVKRADAAARAALAGE